MMKTIPHRQEITRAQIARQIVTALVGTAKKINFYSETHCVYLEALKKLKQLFDGYFSRFGNLQIHIQRNKIFHHNEIMYQGNSEPVDPAFLLHRDGILWVEFQTDLQLYELDCFFRILHDQRIPVEEPEDDIATALWESNLPSILYEAADLELDCQDDLNIDAGSNKCAHHRELADDGDNTRNESIYLNLATCLLPEDGQNENDVWQLSAGERRQLQKMIAAEEKLDGSDYVLDALLYILESHPFEEDMDALLEILLHELREILINGRFAYLSQTFSKLKKIAARHARLKWIRPYFDRLFARLSSRPFLTALQNISVTAHTFDDSRQKEFKRFLMLLDSAAILGLGPIALSLSSVELRQILLEAIGVLAASDYNPLKKLIAESDADLITGMIPVLGLLKDGRARQTLIDLLHHPSASVRHQALKIMLFREQQAIHEIFPLIDDPDERIRSLVLRRLGCGKCAVSEGKILDYLKTCCPRGKNSDHFLAVCRTLGRCGSDRSIPYLSRLLFKWPMMGILRPAGSPRRKGAIAALETLKTKKAARLIERQQRGFFGNLLRSAVFHPPGLEKGKHQSVR